MITTRKSVTRTMIPLEYDKHAGLLSWRMYVRQSVLDTIDNEVEEEDREGGRFLLEAQRQLVKEARYTPTPYLITHSKSTVHGERIDRIVYMCLIISALIIGGILS